MIKYRLKVKVWPVEVAIDVDHADRFGPVLFSGEDYPVGLAREHLFSSHGIDGHFIEEETTPLDLAIAMRSHFMVGFSPELIEGAEILKTTKRRGLP